MRKELLNGLTDEQIAKVKACKNLEEILELAKAEGVELNDEQLQAVSGGGCFSGEEKCPKCGSSDLKTIYSGGHANYTEYKCNKCGYTWKDMFI